MKRLLGLAKSFCWGENEIYTGSGNRVVRSRMCAVSPLCFGIFCPQHAGRCPKQGLDKLWAFVCCGELVCRGEFVCVVESLCVSW